MEPGIRVALPPAKPLVIFDGDCNFCAIWIRRWRHHTGDRVDYLPFQDPSIPERFPELPRAQLEHAVHLITTAGNIYTGAGAGFRALAFNPNEHWLLDWYEHSPLFARTTESAYRFVATHRGFFSFLTRALWGRSVEPSSHSLVRAVFVRSLGLIYLLAFASLWNQISGLIGSGGILPATQTMESVRHQTDSAGITGLARFHVFPTLCWFSASDTSLRVQCAAGTALAILVLIGVAPAPCLFLLWLIYLSLCTICREFLSFQWDILLLEAGFLAIFFAPLIYLPWRERGSPPSKIVLWLLRWLLFCLMFESGCVKLLSQDPTWRDCSALNFHYETQPLPTWIGWYAHQLPASIHKSCTIIMFVIELGVPFLVFAPRRPRHFGCAALLALQIAILLTGNYCFFNLLTILLCLTLLDDGALRRAVGIFRRSRRGNETDGTAQLETGAAAAPNQPRCFGGHAFLRLRLAVTALVALLVLFVSLFQLLGMFARSTPIPPAAVSVLQWLSPFRTFNTYGLFAVMTTSRHEIIVQGSNDGRNWLDYEFKYKPGDLTHRPRFVAPHQPRLDWQMWFAALGDYEHNPWFVQFCASLLRNSPEVTHLLATNPFSVTPPRYIRAVVYDYHFTDLKTRRQSGTWWRKEYRGQYLPVISLRENAP
jgi:predicted DCC family thiol-disulfide oxidoreductase YuxK